MQSFRLPKPFLVILILLLALTVSCKNTTQHSSGGGAQTTGTGGDWESSGGSGVACFYTEADALIYDDVIQAKKKLSDELISRIESLVTVEYWDKKKEVFFEGQSYEYILSAVNQKLLFSSPLFYYKLKQTEKYISISSWEEKTSLESINDVGEIKNLGSSCRVIQLAVRKTQKAAIEQMPKVYVEFDKRLWDLMNPLNQAMLYKHEQVYLLGKQFGHTDSLRTRLLVKFFFDIKMWDDTSASTNGQAMIVQNQINFHFGDYIHLVFEEKEIKDPKPFSGESRYLSFRSLIKKIRLQREKCTLPTNEECFKEAMIYVAITPEDFTEEESFLYYYRWLLTMKNDNSILNSEFSVLPEDDDFLKPYIAKGMKSACENVVQDFLRLPVEISYQLYKALQYCTSGDFKMELFPIVPTETDQN